MDKQTQAVAAAVMRSIKSVQNHWFPSKDNCEQIAKSVKLTAALAQKGE